MLFGDSGRLAGLLVGVRPGLLLRWVWLVNFRAGFDRLPRTSSLTGRPFVVRSAHYPAAAMIARITDTFSGKNAIAAREKKSNGKNGNGNELLHLPPLTWILRTKIPFGTASRGNSVWSTYKNQKSAFLRIVSSSIIPF